MYNTLFAYILGVALAGITCYPARFMPPRAERAMFTGIMTLVAVSFVGFPLEVGHRAGTVNEAAAGLVLIALIGLSLRWPMLLALTFFLHGAWDLGFLTGVIDSHKPHWLVELCVPYDWLVAAYLVKRIPSWQPTEPA